MTGRKKTKLAEREERAARLVQARQRAGLTSAAAAAAQFGWNVNTYKAHESGRNGFETGDAKKYALAFRANVAWLELGVGSPDGPMIASFDPSDPDPIQDFDAEAPDPIDPDQPPTIPANGVVEIDAKPGMGGGGQMAFVYYRAGDQIETRDAIKVHPWIFPPWFLNHLGAHPNDLLMAEATGDSMRPTIEPGTPVIIDTRHKIPSPDGVYAIRDRWGQIQIKRLETSKLLGDPTIRIISDNGGHVELARSEDEIAIVGKVRGGIILF